MPAAYFFREARGFGGTPSARLVLVSLGYIAQNRLDDRPLRLDRVLAREQQMVAGHRVAEQPLVSVHLFALGPLDELEFRRGGFHVFAGPLDLRADRNQHVGAEPEAVAPAPEPLALEPVAPEPVAPELVASEPLALDAVALEPAAAEPAAPEPVIAAAADAAEIIAPPEKPKRGWWRRNG